MSEGLGHERKEGENLEYNKLGRIKSIKSALGGHHDKPRKRKSR